ncbi:zinc-binding dehydrogenase [Alkalibacillus haloalkaliphilus]|uniref:Alcohol dehydrogenase n=1 Tax=Alkalibacillus haloalkaliphilus TaxID=94136 RepID=A0A511W780_9BACI|nr:zinc-binding dehydrogenase [Alkalibacillus haloalkaliphilus]GEN46168.1 alcohol dehydrogenase [Alkalibacillus haloalkaliphilus]
MKALVMEDVKRAVVKDVPDPQIDSKGIVVKNMANGVCRSDWHMWVGDIDFVQPIIGHEFAGVVEEVGSEVKNFKKGDRVIVPFSGSDGTCPYCLKGDTHLCDSFLVPGVAYEGGYGEYVGVPNGDRNVVHIPESVSFKDAAAMGCRFMTSYHGVIDQAQVLPGERVVVYGCGGVGLSAIHIANSMGAEVIGVDINDNNLNLAKQMGAHHIINSINNDPVEAVQEITRGGADVSIDALGIAQTCLNGINSLKKGGRHLQIGVTTQKEAGYISLPIDDMVMAEKSFITTLGMPGHRFEPMLNMVGQGNLNPGQMVTDEISLSEVERVFNDMSDYKTNGTIVVTKFD